MKKPLVDMAPTVARINVTPIIDVALVLVIVLLITAPMIAVADMPITLPAAKTRSTDSDARVNVSLGTDGRVAIDDEDIPAAAFAGVIAMRIQEEGDDLMVVFRADQGVPYESVQQLIKEARTAGAKRLAIATRQPEGGVK